MMTKAGVKKVFSSTLFVVILLCLLFFMEWLTNWYFEGLLPSFLDNVCLCWIILGWALLLFILLIGSTINAYDLSVDLVKRFLNNALALRWLSIVFILGFLIHLSLISEISYYILVNGQPQFIQLLIAVFCLFYLCWIFPIKTNTRNVEDKSKKTLLITGLTVPISTRSLELLFKPFEEISGYQNIKDMVIIVSTKLYEKASNEHPSISSLKKIAQETKYQELQVLADKITLPRGLEFDLKKIDELIHGNSSWIDSYLNYLKENNQNKLNEILIYVLSQYLRVKFPAYSNKCVSFQLTSANYDYNDFDSCFNAIGEVLKNHEKKRKNGTLETLIHISPGTSVVSAAMSIHAIKEYRSLVYTRQDNSVLTSFDVNVWNTQDILKELWKETEE